MKQESYASVGDMLQSQCTGKDRKITLVAKLQGNLLKKYFREPRAFDEELPFPVKLEISTKGSHFTSPFLSEWQPEKDPDVLAYKKRRAEVLMDNARQKIITYNSSDLHMVEESPTLGTITVRATVKSLLDILQDDTFKSACSVRESWKNWADEVQRLDGTSPASGARR